MYQNFFLRSSYQEHIHALTTFSSDEKEFILSQEPSQWDLVGVLEEYWAEEERRLRANECVFLPTVPEQFRVYPVSFVNKVAEAGKYLNELLLLLESSSVPGTSAKKLEEVSRDFFRRNSVKGILPAFVGLDEYPDTISISRNSCVFHGPTDDSVFRDGDIVTVDAGVKLDGANTDAAISLVIGDGEHSDRRRMLNTLRNTLAESLKYLGPGCSLYEHSVFLYDSAISSGYRIVRDSNGHGVGEEVHEHPWVVHWPVEYLKDIYLRPGNIFTIEPIFAEKSTLSVSHSDDFVGFTENGDVGAYREYTVSITDYWVEVLAGIP